MQFKLHVYNAKHITMQKNLKHSGLWGEWNIITVFVFALIFFKEKRKNHGTLLEMEVIVYDWLWWNVFFMGISWWQFCALVFICFEMEVLVYDWLSWNVFQWVCLDDSFVHWFLFVL
jgi:hypothetical protein